MRCANPISLTTRLMGVAKMSDRSGKISEGGTSKSRPNPGQPAPKRNFLAKGMFEGSLCKHV
jgi:hypothetical protein